MQFTKFISKTNFRDSLEQTNKRLLDLVSNTTLALNEELEVLKKDSYHFLTTTLYPKTRVEKTLFSCLASSMKKSEIMSAKSSYVAFLFSIFFIREILKHEDFDKNEQELMGSVDKSLNLLKTIITRHSKQITELGLHKEIDKVCENKSLASVVKEALCLGGLEGKIRIEDSKHQTSNFVIELKTGHCFSLKPYAGFLTDGTWEGDNVKVLPIDGFVDKVSELNSLLNNAKDKKVPMIIIAHGFSEEVVATLKTNKEHGIFNILPVKTHSGIESLNVINDIAIITGTDIVSCVKGEQIQFINYENIVSVSKIRCFADELIVENSEINPNINSHIKTLLKKREQNIAIEDVCNLLDKRIKSLFTHSVVLTLPNTTTMERDSTRIKLDIALRASKTLLTHGNINVDDVINDFQKQSNLSSVDKIFLECLIQTRKLLESPEVPTLSLFLGIYFSIKSILLLLTSNGFVELED